MTIPSVYQPGYAKARKTNPDLAAKYLEHTIIGDPVADDVINALASFNQTEVHQFIHAGMEQDAKTLADAPQPLRDFFSGIEDPPPWFDPASVHAGCRAFHTYSDLFIPAFFVVNLQNAATLISKAFYMTGRVTAGQGPRTIRQNVRYLIEIMLPGALDRQGEGWKLSVRIRLVHAQVRRLIRLSDDWDEAVYGAPLSAAHMAFAAANFSVMMLRQAARLGAHVDDEARASFMQIWRYASWLIGTPEELLFDGDEAQTAEFCRVAGLCEAPPNHESVVIANTLVNALPLVAGLMHPTTQRSTLIYTYRVSRALLGDELADQLKFPWYRTAGLLTWLRWKRGVYRTVHRLAPSLARRWRGKNFVFLLDASSLDDLSYRLPDHLKADRASPW